MFLQKETNCLSKWEKIASLFCLLSFRWLYLHFVKVRIFISKSFLSNKRVHIFNYLGKEIPPTCIFHLWKWITFPIFCEISALILTTVQTAKSKVEILQNFVAFSENMNFTQIYQIFIALFHVWGPPHISQIGRIKYAVYLAMQNATKYIPTSMFLLKSFWTFPYERIT